MPLDALQQAGPPSTVEPSTAEFARLIQILLADPSAPIPNWVLHAWTAQRMRLYADAAIETAALLNLIEQREQLETAAAALLTRSSRRTVAREDPPVTLSYDGAFNSATRTAAQWAADYPLGWQAHFAETGRTLANLTSVQQTALRDIIASQFGEPGSLQRDPAIRAIRDVLAQNPQQLHGYAHHMRGLNRQQANAMAKQIVRLHVDAANKHGVVPPKRRELLERRIARLGDRKRRYRALMIGRTETRTVQMQGILKEADAHIDAGLLRRETLLKEWVATAWDACPICEGLDGDATQVGGTFRGGYAAPPAHPNCRCSIGLGRDRRTADEKDKQREAALLPAPGYKRRAAAAAPLPARLQPFPVPSLIGALDLPGPVTRPAPLAVFARPLLTVTGTSIGARFTFGRIGDAVRVRIRAREAQLLDNLATVPAPEAATTKFVMRAEPLPYEPEYRGRERRIVYRLLQRSRGDMTQPPFTAAQLNRMRRAQHPGSDQQPHSTPPVKLSENVELRMDEGYFADYTAGAANTREARMFSGNHLGARLVNRLLRGELSDAPNYVQNALGKIAYKLQRQIDLAPELRGTRQVFRAVTVDSGYQFKVGAAFEADGFLSASYSPKHALRYLAASERDEQLVVLRIRTQQGMLRELHPGDAQEYELLMRHQARLIVTKVTETVSQNSDYAPGRRILVVDVDNTAPQGGTAGFGGHGLPELLPGSSAQIILVDPQRARRHLPTPRSPHVGAPVRGLPVGETQQLEAATVVPSSALAPLSAAGAIAVQAARGTVIVPELLPARRAFPRADSDRDSIPADARHYDAIARTFDEVDDAHREALLAYKQGQVGSTGMQTALGISAAQQTAHRADVAREEPLTYTAEELLFLEQMRERSILVELPADVEMRRAVWAHPDSDPDGGIPAAGTRADLDAIRHGEASLQEGDLVAAASVTSWTVDPQPAPHIDALPIGLQKLPPVTDIDVPTLVRQRIPAGSVVRVTATRRGSGGDDPVDVAWDDHELTMVDLQPLRVVSRSEHSVKFDPLNRTVPDPITGRQVPNPETLTTWRVVELVLEPEGDPLQPRIPNRNGWETVGVSPARLPPAPIPEHTRLSHKAALLQSELAQIRNSMGIIDADQMRFLVDPGEPQEQWGLTAWHLTDETIHPDDNYYEIYDLYGEMSNLLDTYVANGTGARLIQSVLRGEPIDETETFPFLTEHVREVAAKLQAKIAQAPRWVDEDGTPLNLQLLRAVIFSGSDADIVAGQIMTASGVSSWTANPGLVSYMLQLVKLDEDGNTVPLGKDDVRIMFRTRTDRGLVAGTDGAILEYEILMPHNLQYRVLSVSDDSLSDGTLIRIVDVEPIWDNFNPTPGALRTVQASIREQPLPRPAPYSAAAQRQLAETLTDREPAIAALPAAASDPPAAAWKPSSDIELIPDADTYRAVRVQQAALSEEARAAVSANRDALNSAARGARSAQGDSWRSIGARLQQQILAAPRFTASADSPTPVTLQVLRAERVDTPSAQFTPGQIVTQHGFDPWTANPRAAQAQARALGGSDSHELTVVYETRTPRGLLASDPDTDRSMHVLMPHGMQYRVVSTRDVTDAETGATYRLVTVEPLWEMTNPEPSVWRTVGISPPTPRAVVTRPASAYTDTALDARAWLIHERELVQGGPAAAASDPDLTLSAVRIGDEVVTPDEVGYRSDYGRLASLTDEVVAYAGNPEGSWAINAALRGQLDDEDLPATVTITDVRHVAEHLQQQIVDSAPLGAEREVWRVIELSADEAMFAPGGSYQGFGIGSFSFDPRQALRWLRGHGLRDANMLMERRMQSDPDFEAAVLRAKRNGDHATLRNLRDSVTNTPDSSGSVLFRLRTRRGLIVAHDEYAEERELLMPHGLRYRVIAVEDAELDGRWAKVVTIVADDFPASAHVAARPGRDREPLGISPVSAPAPPVTAAPVKLSDAARAEIADLLNYEPTLPLDVDELDALLNLAWSQFHEAGQQAQRYESMLMWRLRLADDDDIEGDFGAYMEVYGEFARRTDVLEAYAGNPTGYPRINAVLRDPAISEDGWDADVYSEIAARLQHDILRAPEWSIDGRTVQLDLFRFVVYADEDAEFVPAQIRTSSGLGSWTANPGRLPLSDKLQSVAEDQRLIMFRARTSRGLVVAANSGNAEFEVLHPHGMQYRVLSVSDVDLADGVPMRVVDVEPIWEQLPAPLSAGTRVAARPGGDREPLGISPPSRRAPTALKVLPDPRLAAATDANPMRGWVNIYLHARRAIGTSEGLRGDMSVADVRAEFLERADMRDIEAAVLLDADSGEELWFLSGHSAFLADAHSLARTVSDETFAYVNLGMYRTVQAFLRDPDATSPTLEAILLVNFQRLDVEARARGLELPNFAPEAMRQSVADAVAIIQRDIVSAPQLGETRVVYRGIAATDEFDPGVWVEGDTFRSAGFLSASYDPNTALHFADASATAEGATAYLLRIRTRHGLPVVEDDFSNLEILLPHNTQLRVIAVREGLLTESDSRVTLIDLVADTVPAGRAAAGARAAARPDRDPDLFDVAPDGPKQLVTARATSIAARDELSELSRLRVGRVGPTVLDEDAIRANKYRLADYELDDGTVLRGDLDAYLHVYLEHSAFDELVQAYAGNWVGYQRLQAVLRDEDLSAWPGSEFDPDVYLEIAAMLQLRIIEADLWLVDGERVDLDLYRFVTYAADDAVFEPGEIRTSTGFVSWTANPQRVAHMDDVLSALPADQMAIVFRTRTSRGLVAANDRRNIEYEVLHPHGMQYRVVAVTDSRTASGFPVRIVDVEPLWGRVHVPRVAPHPILKAAADGTDAEQAIEQLVQAGIFGDAPNLSAPQIVRSGLSFGGLRELLLFRQGSVSGWGLRWSNLAAWRAQRARMLKAWKEGRTLPEMAERDVFLDAIWERSAVVQLDDDTLLYRSVVLDHDSDPDTTALWSELEGGLSEGDVFEWSNITSWSLRPEIANRFSSLRSESDGRYVHDWLREAPTPEELARGNVKSTNVFYAIEGNNRGRFAALPRALDEHADTAELTMVAGQKMRVTRREEHWLRDSDGAFHRAVYLVLDLEELPERVPPRRSWIRTEGRTVRTRETEIDPWDYNPINEILYGEDYVDEMIYAWHDRLEPPPPILIIEGETLPLSGSHRLFAARKAGFTVRAIEINADDWDETGLYHSDLVSLNDENTILDEIDDALAGSRLYSAHAPNVNRLQQRPTVAADLVDRGEPPAMVDAATFAARQGSGSAPPQPAASTSVSALFDGDSEHTRLTIDSDGWLDDVSRSERTPETHAYTTDPEWSEQIALASQNRAATSNAHTIAETLHQQIASSEPLGGTRQVWRSNLPPTLQQKLADAAVGDQVRTDGLFTALYNPAEAVDSVRGGQSNVLLRIETEHGVAVSTGGSQQLLLPSGATLQVTDVRTATLRIGTRDSGTVDADNVRIVDMRVVDMPDSATSGAAAARAVRDSTARDARQKAQPNTFRARTARETLTTFDAPPARRTDIKLRPVRDTDPVVLTPNDTGLSPNAMSGLEQMRVTSWRSAHTRLTGSELDTATTRLRGDADIGGETLEFDGKFFDVYDLHAGVAPTTDTVMADKPLRDKIDALLAGLDTYSETFERVELEQIAARMQSEILGAPQLDDHVTIFGVFDRHNDPDYFGDLNVGDVYATEGLGRFTANPENITRKLSAQQEPVVVRLRTRDTLVHAGTDDFEMLMPHHQQYRVVERRQVQTSPGQADPPRTVTIIDVERVEERLDRLRHRPSTMRVDPNVPPQLIRDLYALDPNDPAFGVKMQALADDIPELVEALAEHWETGSDYSPLQRLPGTDAPDAALDELRDLMNGLETYRRFLQWYLDPDALRGKANVPLLDYPVERAFLPELREAIEARYGKHALSWDAFNEHVTEVMQLGMRYAHQLNEEADAEFATRSLRAAVADENVELLGVSDKLDSAADGYVVRALLEEERNIPPQHMSAFVVGRGEELDADQLIDVLRAYGISDSDVDFPFVTRAVADPGHQSDYRDAASAWGQPPELELAVTGDGRVLREVNDWLRSGVLPAGTLEPSMRLRVLRNVAETLQTKILGAPRLGGERTVWRAVSEDSQGDLSIPVAGDEIVGEGFGQFTYDPAFARDALETVAQSGVPVLIKLRTRRGLVLPLRDNGPAGSYDRELLMPHGQRYRVVSNTLEGPSTKPTRVLELEAVEESELSLWQRRRDAVQQAVEAVGEAIEQAAVRLAAVTRRVGPGTPSTEPTPAMRRLPTARQLASLLTNGLILATHFPARLLAHITGDMDDAISRLRSGNRRPLGGRDYGEEGRFREQVMAALAAGEEPQFTDEQWQWFQLFEDAAIWVKLPDDSGMYRSISITQPDAVDAFWRGEGALQVGDIMTNQGITPFSLDPDIADHFSGLRGKRRVSSMPVRDQNRKVSVLYRIEPQSEGRFVVAPDSADVHPDEVEVNVLHGQMFQVVRREEFYNDDNETTVVIFDLRPIGDPQRPRFTLQAYADATRRFTSNLEDIRHNLLRSAAQPIGQPTLQNVFTYRRLRETLLRGQSTDAEQDMAAHGAFDVWVDDTATVDRSLRGVPLHRTFDITDLANEMPRGAAHPRGASHYLYALMNKLEQNGWTEPLTSDWTRRVPEVITEPPGSDMRAELRLTLVDGATVRVVDSGSIANTKQQSDFFVPWGARFRVADARERHEFDQNNNRVHVIELTIEADGYADVPAGGGVLPSLPIASSRVMLPISGLVQARRVTRRGTLPELANRVAAARRAGDALRRAIVGRKREATTYSEWANWLHSYVRLVAPSRKLWDQLLSEAVFGGIPLDWLERITRDARLTIRESGGSGSHVNSNIEHTAAMLAANALSEATLGPRGRAEITYDPDPNSDFSANTLRHELGHLFQDLTALWPHFEAAMLRLAIDPDSEAIESHGAFFFETGAFPHPGSDGDTSNPGVYLGRVYSGYVTDIDAPLPGETWDEFADRIDTKARALGVPPEYGLKEISSMLAGDLSGEMYLPGQNALDANAASAWRDWYLFMLLTQ